MESEDRQTDSHARASPGQGARRATRHRGVRLGISLYDPRLGAERPGFIGYVSIEGCLSDVDVVKISAIPSGRMGSLS